MRQLGGRAGSGPAVAGQPGRAVDERHLAARAAQVGRPCGVGRRKGSPGRSSRQLDEVVLPGCEGAGQRGDRVGAETAGASSARVLHGQPGEAHRRRPAIEQFDVVVGVRRPGIAAAAVHLADHDAGRHCLNLLVRRPGDEQRSHHNQGHRHSDGAAVGHLVHGTPSASSPPTRRVSVAPWNIRSPRTSDAPRGGRAVPT